MRSSVTKFLALLLFLGLAYSTPVRAQVSGATLTGTITDPQGGVVADAKVSARNDATGVTSDTTTNSSGLYTIVNLNPGDYTVSFSATGFSTSTSKVTLVVGQKQELSLALTVGQVSQTVEVTGAAPTVETTNATLSGEVEGTQITSLPLNGRDWVSLATLTPGVAAVRPHEAVTAPGGSTRGLGIQMTINGARPQQNVYRLNGVIVNDYSNAGPGNVLGANAGVDAIQEFTVLTGNYSAEYGDTSGGVINAVTKSGTNDFHGSAYEFMRNDVLDASNRFEDPNPLTSTALGKGHFERNQFGASAGYKLWKDKAFIFGNYEGLRQVQAVTQQGKVLTSDARLGIINGPLAGGVSSQLPALVGPCPYASLDPNGMTNEAPGRAAVCVDNFIFAEINPCTSNQTTPCPSGAPPGVLSPLPNGQVIQPTNNDDAYYNSDLGEYAFDDYSTVRGDLRITNNDSLTASWYRDSSTWRKPGLYSGSSLSYSGYQVPHSAYTLEETHIFSTTLVNTVRAGLAISDLASPAFSNANPFTHATTLCVVPPSGGACVNEQIGIQPGWVAGGGSVGGNGNSGNSTTLTGAQGGFTGAPGFGARTAKIEAFDDISKTIGNHTLKFGVMMVDDHEDWVNGPAGQGGGGPSYAGVTQTDPVTGKSVPCNPAVVPLPLQCGGGVAAYLLDIPHTVRMPIEPPFAPIGSWHHWRSQIYAGYFADDWKLSSNLTINLGLRYEMSTIPSVTDNNINNIETLDQSIPALSAVNSCIANSVGFASCPGFYHTTFQKNPTLANFEPRLGFAWDPFHDGKTSIRGGAGIFDVLPLSYMFALNSIMVAPSAAETDLSYSTNSAVLLAGGGGWGHFPTTETADVTNPALVSNSGAAQRWGYVQPNPKRNYVAQYNLNIQRQITPTITVMIAYAGSKSWHDPLQEDDLNMVVPYTVNGRYIWPNSSTGGTTAAGLACVQGTAGCTGLTAGDGGCSPGPPNCSQTDAYLGLPINYVTPSATCVNGMMNLTTSQGCISANNGITPGLLINSHTAQFQTELFPVQSWYNALQIRVDKKVSHGLLVGGSFSWGKSFDNSSSSFASDNYSNNPSAITPYWDPRITRGLSDFNVTKNLSINVLYTIPTPASWNGILKAVTGGWGVGGNFEASDGIPLWPLAVSDVEGMLGGGPYDIPDLAPGCQEVNTNWRQTLQYLNPNCYTIPQAPSMAFYNGSGSPTQPSTFNPGCDKGMAYPNCTNLFGNDPRNNVIGPGLINLDMSFTKDSYIHKISENFDLQFRAELFNIANHPNYAFPVANNLGSLQGNAAFGTLTQTQSSERQVQFALKAIW